MTKENLLDALPEINDFKPVSFKHSDRLIKLFQGNQQPVTVAHITIILMSVVVLVLIVWRQLDHMADRAEMARLLALQPKHPAAFAKAMIAGLPTPAQRYFAFSIQEGTPLYTVAQIKMAGKFSLGSKNAPNYMKMAATQVLAAPTGFVWKMSGGTWPMSMSGSDSGSWTRFWLAGMVPVARLGGDPDHTRAAFGRFVAEAVFWTPAALLSGPDVVWEAVSDEVARVTIRRHNLQQTVDVTVAEDGRPVQIAFPRWSDANPEKVFRIQPFGGFLSEFNEFQGFRLPTHIEAGNFFDTSDYFPFFIADVTEVRFPVAPKIG